MRIGLLHAGIVLRFIAKGRTIRARHEQAPVALAPAACRAAHVQRPLKPLRRHAFDAKVVCERCSETTRPLSQLSETAPRSAPCAARQRRECRLQGSLYVSRAKSRGITQSKLGPVKSKTSEIQAFQAQPDFFGGRRRQLWRNRWLVSSSFALRRVARAADAPSRAGAPPLRVIAAGAIHFRDMLRLC